jgi:hypothetical protein
MQKCKCKVIIDFSLFDCVNNFIVFIINYSIDSSDY